MTTATIPTLTTTSSRIPIAIITGFLGSGKTTLLNKLLRHPAMQNAAVVINELGTISIDHLLVRAATEDIVIIDGGCVCCTVRGDLVQTLADLWQKRVAGEVPAFDRVVMETTGLADPAPIIHTLLEDPILKPYYALGSIVTTVDCLHGSGQLEDHYETVKQIAVADRLLLTKMDLVTEISRHRLAAKIAHINPAARIMPAEMLNITELFDAGLYNPETKALDVQQWLQAEAFHDSQHPAHVHEEGHEHAHEHGDRMSHHAFIEAFCVEYREPIALKAFNYLFQQLKTLRGKDLLRVKGVIYTKEHELPILVQGVQHVFQPPVSLPAWQGGERKTQLVFITRHIHRSVLEKMLETLVGCESRAEACQAALILLGA